MGLPALAFWNTRTTPADYLGGVRQGLAASLAALETHLTASARSVDAHADVLRALVTERADLLAAYAARWGGAQPYGSANGPRPPADLLAQLRNSRLPWFQSGRIARQQLEAQWTHQRLAEIESGLVAELSRVASAWDRIVPAPVDTPAQASAPLLPAIEDSARSISRVQPGEGPLVIQVGDCAWGVEAHVPQPGTYGSGSVGSRRTAGVRQANPFPALVDLVRDGGFATDHRATVESAVVRLMALLPAGRLKVHLFDPVKVGASLKFLSDLADTTRAAVADVRVVAADLEPLLDDLTRHVARVTQQYLGSRHASLADYNRAAGEVAEAYHLLVLMDFPAGRVDDDVIRKLDTLVKAGPACGVFTLVLSASPEQYSFGLPVLRTEVWVDPSQVMPGMRAALPTVRSGTPTPSVEAIASKDWRRYVGLTPLVFWRGSAWTPSTAPEVRELVTRLDAHVRDAKPRSVDPTATSKRLRAMHGRTSDADPSDPSTWWRKDSTTGIEATIGVTGDRDVATVVFESAGSEPGLLIGGQPGTGKSVLLHALIGDIVRNYSPAQVELYLLDPKQGVEFTVYAQGQLPHAKVVTVQAGPESTLLVLEDLIAQIVDRGERFRDARMPDGSIPDKLDDYRRAPGAVPLARIVAVVDEFQALLNTGDDETSARAARLLDRAIREGRAFGIHLVLATQSLQGITHLPAAIMNMIESKVVLRVSEDDSRLFLGPHDLEASRLGKGSGAAILKRPGVEKRQIQVTNETKGAVGSTVRTLAAKVSGQRVPTVLDFSRPRPPSRLYPRADGPSGISLLVARGLGVDESVTVTLPVNDDAHVLVVAGSGRRGDGGASLGILSAMIATAAAAKVPFDVVDFGDLQTPFDLALSGIQQAVSNPQRRFARGRMLDRVLDEALALVRRPAASAATQRLLFVTNAHRSRDLVDGSELADKLAELLREGGAARVNVILHADTGAAAGNITSATGTLRLFGARVFGYMDADSSYQLLGSNAAEKLSGDRLVVWEQGGTLTGAVAFAPIPATAWARLGR